MSDIIHGKVIRIIDENTFDLYVEDVETEMSFCNLTLLPLCCRFNLDQAAKMQFPSGNDTSGWFVITKKLAVYGIHLIPESDI